MSLDQRFTTLFLCLILSQIVACDTSDGVLEVYFKRSPDVNEDPFDPKLVSYLRIKVTAPDIEPREKIVEFSPGALSTIPGIPVGKRRVISVEGLSGENGYAVSRGRTVPITISEGHQYIELFVARVGRFSFTPGEGFAKARFAHVSSVTKSGKILFIGGAASGPIDAPRDILGSIEAYDPTSGGITRFSCNGSDLDECLKMPRAHAAGVAIEEKLALFGGTNSNGALSVIERLDTAKRSAEQMGESSTPRYRASVLSAGDLHLVVGGISASGEPTDLIEIIDNDLSITEQRLPVPREGMAAAGASEFGILFGGNDQNGIPTSDYFLFDPQSRVFSHRESEIEPRTYANAVALSGGWVLILGGLNAAGQASASIDLYDRKSDRLCRVAELNHARWLSSSVRLEDGRVMVIGGLSDAITNEPTSRVEMLDPRYVEVGSSCDEVFGVLAVTDVPDMRIGRYRASAVYMPNGSVLVAGGLDGSTNPVSQLETFVPDE